MLVYYPCALDVEFFYFGQSELIREKKLFKIKFGEVRQMCMHVFLFSTSLILKFVLKYVCICSEKVSILSIPKILIILVIFWSKHYYLFLKGFLSY